MADVKASTWKKRAPAPVGSNNVQALIYTLTATPGAADNDTLKIAELPRSITLLDAYVSHTDGDTHATPTAVFSLQVTDGTTTKTLIDASTIAQGGGFIRSTKSAATETALGYTLPTDLYWLRLLWSTKAATPASSTVVVKVEYTGFYDTGALTE